ncbi:bola protein [Kockiozyma suomiensis]|uniref:bola protein n=1 Tax=Kockiozyma suomiensis TaxID=1337062 RepID=UPI003343CE4C
MLARSLRSQILRSRQPLIRRFATSDALDPAEVPNDYEKFIASKLFDALEPSQLSVKDISGGCGSMFAINIVSKAFKGKPMIKQHRMVNDILADDLKQWHGVQLKTKAE